MPQATPISGATYRERIQTVRDAMKEFGLEAIVLEPGPAMQYLTGVRWGRSERAFVLVLPLQGDLAFVVPGFEEMRAREMIPTGAGVLIWQEDESPYQRVVQALRKHGVTSGRVGVDPSARFFVLDGIRKLAPKLDYVSARAALRSAGAAGQP